MPGKKMIGLTPGDGGTAAGAVVVCGFAVPMGPVGERVCPCGLEGLIASCPGGAVAVLAETPEVPLLLARYLKPAAPPKVTTPMAAMIPVTIANALFPREPPPGSGAT